VPREEYAKPLLPRDKEEDVKGLGPPGPGPSGPALVLEINDLNDEEKSCEFEDRVEEVWEEVCEEVCEEVWDENTCEENTCEEATLVAEVELKGFGLLENPLLLEPGLIMHSSETWQPSWPSPSLTIHWLSSHLRCERGHSLLILHSSRPGVVTKTH